MRPRTTGASGTIKLVMCLAIGALFHAEAYSFSSSWMQAQSQSRASDMEGRESREQSPDTSGGKKSTGYILGRVKEWREASLDHVPGRPDPAAVAIGKWESDDLEIVVDFLTKLASRSEKTIRRTIAATPVRNRLRLTDTEVQEGDLNRILKQGALLHTDIALLNLQKAQKYASDDLLGAFIDGRVLLTPKVIHWELARRLVNAVSPSPSKDPMVKLWYIATTATLQSRRYLAYAGENIESALEIFPPDTTILLYAGALHESRALPVNQNVQMPSLRHVSYGSRTKELKRARKFYQESIAVSPDFGEAHLRLGRVQGLLGQHEQAVQELSQAQALIRDPLLSYYVSLFLGREFEMSSLPGKARIQYEHSGTLYPSAQSPRLALSQLDYYSGDAPAAMQCLDELFSLRIDDPWREDPLWFYDLSHVLNAADLLEELYRMFGGLPR